MKILVCGKGGCGKSVIVTLIAKELVKRGKRVLVVDMDESNYNVYRNFGVDKPRDIIELLGGKENVRKNLMRSMKSGERAKHFDSVRVSEIPKEFSSEKNGIKIISIGKIHEFGEGCACPIGAVTREFIQKLEIEKDEFVVVDTDAGIEHFGRGVEEGCDVIVAVVDPNFESIQLAKKIVEISRKIGKKVVTVANKVDEKTEKFIKADVYLPYKEEIFEACLKGEEIPDIKEAERIVNAILD